MSDYTEKNSNLIPQIDIPCFAWNSQAEQGFLFFKAKSLPEIWAFLVTVHSYPVPVTDFADASHSKSAQSAATTVSYGIFYPEFVLKHFIDHRMYCF